MKSIFLLMACALVLSTGCDLFAPKALKLAKNHYETECAKGNLSKCRDLALLYVIKKQHEDAIEILKVGCDRGDHKSCGLQIIETYEKNKSEVSKMALKLCQQRVIEGCRGLILVKENKQARELLIKFCQENHLESCSYLAHSVLEDDEAQLARSFAQKACEGGVASGCDRLSEFMDKNNEMGGALAMAEKSCNLDPLFCGDLGKLQSRRSQFEAAWKTWSKGCASGGYVSCEELRNSGKFTMTSEKQTKLKQECDVGEMRSCWILGVFAENNENVKEAKRFYEFACEGAFISACGFLEKMK